MITTELDENSEVKNIDTEHTGGNIYNDILKLKNGQVIVITSDAVCLYKDLDHYYEDNLECRQEIECINRYND